MARLVLHAASKQGKGIVYLGFPVNKPAILEPEATFIAT